MALAAVHEAGFRGVDLGVAHDDEGGLAARLEAALSAGADVLLTSGGVSMGALPAAPRTDTHTALTARVSQATATW